MVGFTLLSRSYYYLRRRSPGPPFPPDHRQAGERGAIRDKILARDGKCRWTRRSCRSWRRCEHACSTVVRAALSPTATLLLLLVASLLAISLMLHCCCALVLMSDNITMAAACWSWCMSISNSSIEVQLARASPLDMLVLVDEVRMQAGLHTIHILLHEASWCTWSSELADLFHIWRTACSRSFDWCAVRRRRLRAAGVSGVDS